MKKLITLLLCALLSLSLSSIAEESAPVVCVSITDDAGAIVLALAPVEVTDVDNDSVLTINDALSCAHAAYHEAGADAFSSIPTEYGISLVKLWNIDNGGSFGYCLNNTFSLSLLDPVKAGDHIKAYAYTDLETWSDTYAYFSADTVTAAPGSEVSLTLIANGYDAFWNPVSLNVAGASITVNGADTGIVTGENGAFTLKLDDVGVLLVSASASDMTLVSPVCIITVTEG